MRLWTAAAVLLGTGAVAVTSARLASRRFLFPGHQVSVVTPPPGVERWALTATDGETVHALSLPATRGDARRNARVVVHFHNNRETMVEPLWLARGLAERGVDVVLAEYRGYGLSREGAAPSEEGLYRDAEATLDELGRRGFGAERIVLWGTSLGTGVAAEMARRHRGSALILVSPYTSIASLVAHRAWLSPPGFLLPDRFDTAAKATDLRMPTLIVHGDDDEIVPFFMGEELSTAIPGATLVRVSAGRHGDLFARRGEELLDRFAAFAE